VDLSDLGEEADELVVEGYLASRPIGAAGAAGADDASRLSRFEHDGTITQTEFLILLPDHWTDTPVEFRVRALSDGTEIGGAARVLIPPRHQVQDVPMTLRPGALNCGNGVVDTYELCDGTDFGGATCTEAAGLLDGELLCKDCRLNVSNCFQCGNGSLEGPEDCEGQNLNGQTCTTLGRGFVGGTLRCDGKCQFDLAGCNLGCGNGRVDPGEECDGNDLQGESCHSLGGFTAGALACDDQCRFDLSGCSVCGNGQLEGTEECDGAAFGNLTCSDLGFAFGQLGCVGCEIDTSNCCGDGVAGYLEDCDGADVGGRTCSSVTYNLLPDGQLACSSGCDFDISGCHNCGNRTLEGPEDCDGDNLGGQDCLSLGMPHNGTLACNPDCTFDTADCDVCGTGVTSSDEECDDGNTEPGDGCAADCTLEAGWTCDTSVQPARCKPVTCGDGNGTIDPPEVCDGANLGGETCLSQGYLQGGGAGLACEPTCTALDPSGCIGGAIDSVAQIEDALTEANASTGHEVIAVHGGSYNPTDSIVLDECGGGACSGGRPYGVTVQPRPGETVCFTPTGTFPVFDVYTGENAFFDLCFDEVPQAFMLNAGADAGGNLVRNCRFENSASLPDIILWVDSRGNEILANWFVSQTPQLGTRAILLSEEDNIAAMNAISGPFEYAIQVGTGAGASQVTKLDHNSVRITGSLSGGGVLFLNANEICYRNNIVYGDGTSTGLEMNSLSFAPQPSCGGDRAAANVNLNHAVACTDVSGACATYCDGTSATIDLCDLTQSPNWSDEALCLSPGSSPLIDVAATNLFQAYDHDDSTSAVDFVGSGPDVGAREDGAQRRYGGVDSACP